MDKEARMKLTDREMLLRIEAILRERSYAIGVTQTCTERTLQRMLKAHLWGEVSEWEKNEVQFPRMLSEILGVGLSREQYVALSETMDLTPERINELFDRADAVWQEDKERMFSRRQH